MKHPWRIIKPLERCKCGRRDTLTNGFCAECRRVQAYRRHREKSIADCGREK